MHRSSRNRHVVLAMMIIAPLSAHAHGGAMAEITNSLGLGHNGIEDISTGIATTVLTARTPGNKREERFRNVPGACRGASWEEEQTQLKLSGPRNVPNSNFSCCISDGIFNVIS